MSIRKRVLPSGQVRWQLDYKDGAGARRAKQFEFQWQAKEYETKVRGEVRDGLHVPDSTSITVAEAGEIWLQECRSNQLERGTLRNYKNLLDRHILPSLRNRKLSELSRPACESFKNKLLEKGCSRTLTKKVLTSLGSLLSVSQKRGLIVQMPLKACR